MPLLAAADHFFTTRDLLVDDRALVPAQAAEARLAGAIGVSPGHLLTLRQVHGAAVAVARHGLIDVWTPPEADALVTDDPAYAVAVRVADCAPVLIADGRRGVVAVVHAGWRGTMAGAAVAGVRGLIELFGSSPADLVAAIGPCLGPCCGEVGEEVVSAFRGAGHGEEAIDRWFVRQAGARPSLNLWRANRDQLEAAGVPPAHVHVAELCTRTHAEVFHSYRAAGRAAGRMYGVIRTARAVASPRLAV